MENGENIINDIEDDSNKNNNKKDKKSKKMKKKQRKEEERKKKELEKEKEKQKENNEEDSNKNKDIEGKTDNDLKEDKEEEKKDKSENSNEKEKEKETKEFIIDTSSKNINNEEDEDEKENEIITTSSKQKENNDEEENDNNNEEQEENNDSIYKIIKKLKKSRKGSICQELNIKEDECNYIIEKAYPIFQKETSLLKISAPLYICGDIHGQYYDLLRVFDILNYPPTSTFLFLGDYVDRGKQSLECILLLLCLKIKYPDKIFLLRGNHESESINKIYGFYDECKRRLSVKCFKKIINLFNMLPISALINENILCMHGGLSKELKTIDQINNILRPTDIPDEGLLCDLLWSDPNETLLEEDYGKNERNISVTFSKKVVKEFEEKNNLDLICRAHQVVEEGFEFFAEMKLVTIFTAPNYMGEFDNNGGILEVGEDLLCKFHILKPNFERTGKRRRITELVN